MKLSKYKARYLAIGIFSMVQLGLFSCASQEESEDPVADQMQEMEEKEGTGAITEQSKNEDVPTINDAQTSEEAVAEPPKSTPEEATVGWNSEGAPTSESTAAVINEQKEQQKQEQQEDYTVGENKSNPTMSEKSAEAQPELASKGVTEDQQAPAQDLFKSEPTEEPKAGGSQPSPEEKSQSAAESIVDKQPITDQIGQETASPSAVSEISAKMAPEGKSKKPYIVMPGDTLASIAQEIYGSSNEWKTLATLNSIKNPNRIYPGDLIYYGEGEKTSGFSKALASSIPKVLEVQKGDTLSGIAMKFLGNSNYWKTIWKLNQDTITNPDKIQVGQKINYFELRKVAREDDKSDEEEQAH